MLGELQQEGSSSELKILTGKVKAAKTAKDIADILSKGKVNLPSEEMSRLEKIASSILERMKQEEIDKLKISTNQASQDSTLKIEKQTQKEVDRHNSNVEPVYRKFDSVSPKLLLEQENTIKNLDEALALNKKGEPISEELKKKLTLSPQELEKQAKAWDVVDETFKVATQEKAYHQQKINDLEKLHPDLDSKPKNHPLKTQRELHQNLLAQADGKLKEAEKHYELRKEWAERISRGTQEAIPKNKDFWTKEAKEFQEGHRVSHESVLSGKSHEDIWQQRSLAFNNRSDNQKSENPPRKTNKIKEALQSFTSSIKSNVKKLFNVFKTATEPDLTRSGTAVTVQERAPVQKFGKDLKERIVKETDPKLIEKSVEVGKALKTAINEKPSETNSGSREASKQGSKHKQEQVQTGNQR